MIIPGLLWPSQASQLSLVFTFLKPCFGMMNFHAMHAVLHRAPAAGATRKTPTGGKKSTFWLILFATNFITLKRPTVFKSTCQHFLMSTSRLAKKFEKFPNFFLNLLNPFSTECFFAKKTGVTLADVLPWQNRTAHRT